MRNHGAWVYGEDSGLYGHQRKHFAGGEVMKHWHTLRYPAVTLLAVGCLFAQAQQSTPQKPNPQEPKTKSQQAEKPPRKRVVTDLSGFDLLEPSKVQKQTTVVGGTRGLPRPVALAPRLGKLFGTTPEFAWSCAGDFR